MRSLTIPRDILDRMIAHCRSGYPDEVCGLLAGNADSVLKIYEMKNAEPSPFSYLMEPGGQFRAMKDMRAEGTSIVAIYHSHPASPAYPSARDVSLAFYPDSVYIIVSLIDFGMPDIRAFEIVEGVVKTAVLQVP